MSDNNRLEHFPVTLFASIMGLTGFALAWQKAQGILKFHIGLNWPLAILAAAVFGLLAIVYISKWITHPGAVKQEISHPVKLSFFLTISISLILLGTVFMHLYTPAAMVFWWAGVVLQLVLLLFVLNCWVNHEHFEVGHLNPSWFIPAVGNALVPIAGMEWGYVEISWFFFAVGMIFWLILMTILFNRIMFHNPMPQRLVPTLVILIAPPAVGFVAYFKLVGGLDSFGRVLYATALFFTLFLIPRFAKLPFFLSWWAYSFPVASVTIATLLMFKLTGVMFYKIIAIVLLAMLTLIIAYLIVRTIMAAMSGKICVPE